jgi:hypothetical protein
VTVRVWLSFSAPDVIPVRLSVWRGESSGMITFEMESIAGGSFTGLTVTVNVRVTMLFEVPPSFKVTVIVAVPEALATGVILSVATGLGLV